MQLSDIISRVKELMRDYNNFNWSDVTIKKYINDGYIEFATETRCLKKHSNITITSDTALFDAPSDNILIDRARWADNPVRIRTTEEMDFSGYGYSNEIVSTNWRESTGSGILYLIQDAEGYDQFRIYPIIDDADDIGGLVLGTDSNTYKCILAHTSASTNKPITGADYATYWELTTSNGTGVTWESGKDYKKYYNLVLDHSYIPAELSSDTDVPVIPSRFHKALVEYTLHYAKMTSVGVEKDYMESSIHSNMFDKYIEMCRGDVGRGFTSYRNNRVKTRPFI